MRAVVQRVSRASVAVEGRVVGEIGPGLLVLLGVARGDAEADADTLAKDRPPPDLPDPAGQMNRRPWTWGAILAASQFTLLGDCRKGGGPATPTALPRRPRPVSPLRRRVGKRPWPWRRVCSGP